jgi:hypothetical protein
MSSYLSFYFNVKDPKFDSFTTVPRNSPYIAHAFINAPIYDQFGIQIGTKVSDDYIQQVDVAKYVVRISSTYVINGKGTITWQYSFEHSTPDFYYPIGVLANSNIVSTTGDYYGKTGVVSLNPTPDGKRTVTIGFNF